VSAYLSTAGKAAVLAVLIRFLYESGAVHSIIVLDILGLLAGISIVVGNLLAIQQNSVKRMLAYSSIAHFGYLLIALSAHLASPEAVTVYLVTYIVMTLGAFGVVSLMSSPYKGQDADQLHNYRGLFWRRPYLTAVMTVMMLSLAGIPVTAGFIGKFYIAAAGVAAHLWWLMALLIAGSAVGLYYYLRVMIIMFLPQPSMHRHDAPLNWGIRASGMMVLGLTVLLLLIGLYPQPLITLIEWARPAIMN
jgi:NADH-quinone oxidoreductase subunit N